MEPVFNAQTNSYFLVDRVGDGHDSFFGLVDRLFSATTGDSSCFVCALVDIDLCSCALLDLVDGYTTFAQDPWNRASRYSKFDLVI